MAYVVLVVIGLAIVLVAGFVVRKMLTRSDPRTGWGITVIATVMVTWSLLMGLVAIALYGVAR